MFNFFRRTQVPSSVSIKTKLFAFSKVEGGVIYVLYVKNIDTVDITTVTGTVTSPESMVPYQGPWKIDGSNLICEFQSIPAGQVRTATFIATGTSSTASVVVVTTPPLKDPNMGIASGSYNDTVRAPDSITTEEIIAHANTLA